MQAFALLRPLARAARADPRKALGATFEGMAKLLDRVGESATTQFTVLTPDGVARWRLDLGESGTSCREGAADAADLEIVVGEGTWWEIASGELSPVDAFARGELRILGDAALATRLYKALAAPEGVTDVCF